MIKIGEVSFVHNNIVNIKILKTLKKEEMAKYSLTSKGDIIEINGINSMLKISSSNIMVILKVTKQYFRDDSIFIEGYVNGFIEQGKYKFGVSFVPSINDSAYFIEEADLEIISFISRKKAKIRLGTNSLNNPTLIDLNKLLNSHNGIFGATGQGKSYTLSNIITKSADFLIDNKLKNPIEFVVLDTNGEYSNKKFTDKYNSNIWTFTKDLFINFDENNLDFLYLIFGASEKTQKPFLNKIIINSLKYEDTNILVKELKRINSIGHEGGFSRYKNAEFRLRTLTTILDEDEDFYKVCNEIITVIEEKITSNHFYNNAKENDIESIKIDLSSYKLNRFEYFIILLIFNLIDSDFQRNHIEPLINRIINNFQIWEKLFSINDNSKTFDEVFINRSKDERKLSMFVFNLSKLTIGIKRNVMKFMSQKIYNEKRKNFLIENKNIRTILYLDEVHVMDNKTDDQELSILDEIVREGRKFKLFITYSTQMPNLISESMIAQTSNLFIHRIKNYKDYKSIEPFIKQFNINELFLFSLGVGEALVIGDVILDYQIVLMDDPVIKPLKDDDEIF
ncbi:ATP-binding protein [Spiroplasma endosymbiont of Diplazon laetatorius]|uniref:ATP-binding protein n=1 Tax=Spiroplasma endosymbiont of Diplazon laetatorius TaxID=3066322 RepID=UPI0030D4ABEB